MINKDKLFKLFIDGNEVVSDKTQEEVDNFLNEPYAKIGMFVKLIQNHYIFHQKLEKFLKKEQPNYNVESTKQASEFTVYNRAWSYISQLNLSDDKEVINSFDPITFSSTLESAISYFESYEEYEKCAFLVKIKKLIK